MLFYVIAYDIPCDKRRKKIADLLEGYGSRVQYSVFECVLTKSKFNELRQRLEKKYREGEDSVRFYPLSSHTLSQVEVWGEPALTQPPTSTTARESPLSAIAEWGGRTPLSPRERGWG